MSPQSEAKTPDRARSVSRLLDITTQTVQSWVCVSPDYRDQIYAAVWPSITVETQNNGLVTPLYCNCIDGQAAREREREREDLAGKF